MPGSRAAVMHGNASCTVGGLKKANLKYNKVGEIVSKTKSRPLAKKLKKNEFYCVACRKRRVCNSCRETRARVTKQKMLVGKCPSCENKMTKFIK